MGLLALYLKQKEKEKVKNKAQGKESVDNQLADIDFFSQMTYMAAIATSGIARSGLFYYSAKLPYIATRYFRRVDFVAKMFNHDYAQACRIVGEKIKIPDIKALLLRLSNALASGEDVCAFLAREAFILSESYSSSYERKIDLLKKWADAYVSLILTSALVTVMSVVTMMIGSVSVSFIISISAITILCTIFGAWFLYNTAPRETKNHALPFRSHEQNTVKYLCRILLPAGGFVLLVMLVMKLEIGYMMIAASLFLFPIGFAATADDKKVTARDTDVSAFLRSLSGTMQAIGATAAEAMGRLDFRSLGILSEDVKLLYTRLGAGVSPNLCWDRFVGETGSELVNRSVRIFWDGVTLGGEPQKVGNEASTFAMKISLLRAQRAQVSMGFTWLTIAMHAVLVALSIFVYEVFLCFSTLVSSIIPDSEKSTMNSIAGMPSTGFVAQSGTEIHLLHFMIVLITIILTLANAFSIYAVSGGHSAKLAYYLAMTSLISGLIMVGVPPVVHMMFTVFK
jgi:flagellar protein FlaJ